jgi:hypothetical protein
LCHWLGLGRQNVVQERTRNDLRADAARVSWRDSNNGQSRHNELGAWPYMAN